MTYHRTVCALLVALAPSAAFAHIAVDFPVERGGSEKIPHCGDRPRGTPNVFRPGQTITVRWRETIPHPGHYRIAFNPNGATFGLPPTPDQTTQGIDPQVLIDLIPDKPGNGTYTQDITFPDIECDNCTLQVIQLMTDKPPYSINYPNDPNANDIYFHCADIVLSRNSPDAAPAGTPDASPTPTPTPTPDSGGGNNNNPPTTVGGCVTAGGSAGALFGSLLALGLVRRRRRR